MKKWKVLEEEDVSPDKKWMPVRRHKVELPNGTIVDDYYFTVLPDGVIILPVTKEGKIVLVKQYKHGAGEITIELPAGTQEEGKTLEETVIEELEEEVGIKTTKDNLIPLGRAVVNPPKMRHTNYGYLARNLEFNSKQKLDVTEDIEVIEVSPKKVLEMVKSGEISESCSVTHLMRAYLKFPEIFK
jgi:ADP-ribose pyrophosphatase